MPFGQMSVFQYRKSLTNLISDHALFSSFGTSSYWVRITSGMFRRHVPMPGTRLFVRHDFLGLISSWVPVRTSTPGIEVAQTCSVGNGAQAD